MTNDIRRQILPYVLIREPGGTHVAFNRAYRRVGSINFLSGEFESPRIEGLSEKDAQRLSYDGSQGLDRIHLYDDGCIPTHDASFMRDYLAKLSLLASHDGNAS